MSDGFDVVVGEIEKSGAAAYDVADAVGSLDAGSAALTAGYGISGAAALGPLAQFAYGALTAALELSRDIAGFADALTGSAHSYVESDRQADETLDEAQARANLP